MAGREDGGIMNVTINKGLRYAANCICLLGMFGAVDVAAAPVNTATRHDVELVDEAVHSWAQSWDRGDVSQYLEHYADDFVPAGGLTRAQWEQQRRMRLKSSAIHQVMLRNLELAVDSNTAQAQFTQYYLDLAQISTARKRLTLVKQAGSWKIREEQIEAERVVHR
jgi:ketosteroid isomerase-like protein